MVPESTPRRVLIVEDDQSIREVLQSVLECESFETVGVTNGREALDVLRTGELPGLILLDLTMPVMNGWDFLIERNQDPQLASIPVIVCSATGEKRIPENAKLVIKKPIELSTLLDAVNTFYQSSTSATL
jgi:chemotaxis family two-component system sensor histidine kinase/response regulator PixL